MKNFDLSHFLGCCVIGASIVAAGWLIGRELPDTPHIPSNLSVTSSGFREKDESFGKYLSEYEVAAYLSITDEDVELLLSQGELEGTYLSAGSSRMFSREKLDEWVENRLG